MQVAPQGGFTTTFTPYCHPFPSTSLFFKGLYRPIIRVSPQRDCKDKSLSMYALSAKHEQAFLWSILGHCYMRFIFTAFIYPPKRYIFAGEITLSPFLSFYSYALVHTLSSQICRLQGPCPSQRVLALHPVLSHCLGYTACSNHPYCCHLSPYHRYSSLYKDMCSRGNTGNFFSVATGLCRNGQASA